MKKILVILNLFMAISCLGQEMATVRILAVTEKCLIKIDGKKEEWKPEFSLSPGQHRIVVCSPYVGTFDTLLVCDKGSTYNLLAKLRLDREVRAEMTARRNATGKKLGLFAASGTVLIVSFSGLSEKRAAYHEAYGVLLGSVANYDEATSKGEIDEVKGEMVKYKANFAEAKKTYRNACIIAGSGALVSAALAYFAFKIKIPKVQDHVTMKFEAITINQSGIYPGVNFAFNL